MGQTYREASKADWSRTDGSAPKSFDELRTGCLQRIAAATEVMANRYTDLLDQVRRERDYRGQVQERLERERRRTAALRGVIGRLKRKGGGK